MTTQAHGAYALDRAASGPMLSDDGGLRRITLKQIKDARMHRQFSRPTAGLFNRETLDHGNSHIEQHFLSDFVASDTPEGQPPAELQRYNVSTTTARVKRVSVECFISAQARHLTRVDLRGKARMSMATAMANKENADAIATFLRANRTEGSSDMVLGWTNLTRLVNVALTGRDFTGNRPIVSGTSQLNRLRIVHHGNAFQRFFEEQTNAVKGDFNTSLRSFEEYPFTRQENFLSATLPSNIPIVMDNNIPVSTDGGATGAIFIADAIWRVGASFDVNLLWDIQDPRVAGEQMGEQDFYGMAVMDPRGIMAVRAKADELNASSATNPS